MRAWSAAVLVLAALPAAGAEKLSWEDRVELTRGLTAEYAKVKQFLPRSKKPLAFEADGTYDKAAWQDAGKQYGPAARVGDVVQVTKISIEDDRLVLQINGGFRGGRKWYQSVQLDNGSGVPMGPNTSNAPGGTTIEILFHKPLEPIKAMEVKAILARVLDFEKRTVTEVYAESLKPEVRTAIKDKRVLEGMDRDQVVMAMGRPAHKSREVKDGLELEDWVYGQPPGKIVFVTFNGSKVVKVKESYAGLGTEVADPATPVQR